MYKTLPSLERYFLCCGHTHFITLHWDREGSYEAVQIELTVDSNLENFIHFKLMKGPGTMPNPTP
jgi:hypothetical protein